MAQDAAGKQREIEIRIAFGGGDDSARQRAVGADNQDVLHVRFPVLFTMARNINGAIEKN